MAFFFLIKDEIRTEIGSNLESIQNPGAKWKLSFLKSPGENSGLAQRILGFKKNSRLA